MRHEACSTPPRGRTQQMRLLDRPRSAGDLSDTVNAKRWIFGRDLDRDTRELPGARLQSTLPTPLLERCGTAFAVFAGWFRGEKAKAVAPCGAQP
jgi:hypothetical protein